MSLAHHRERLYRAASSDGMAEELAIASHLMFEGPPPEEQWDDFIDFFAIEWVNADGYTLLQRLTAEGALPPELEEWSRRVKTALWVVDGWKEQKVLLRDLATEAEYAVDAPGLEPQLPRRMVLRARVVPWNGGWIFSGAPELVEPMGVIARLQLLRQWQEGPEPSLLARMEELRGLYQQLREEREAWIHYFGRDEVVFESAEHLGRELSGLVNHLFNVWPFPSLQGRTRAQARRERKGDAPEIVQFQLGDSLSGPGRHAAIYDPVEGIHFLPAYGEFLAHVRGEESHPTIFEMYEKDPGITSLPFRRAGIGLPASKPPVPRWTLSLLPGIEEER